MKPIARRRFLQAATISGAAGILAAHPLGLTDTAAGADPSAGAAMPSSSFYGPHQAGVLDPGAPSTMFAAFDVIANDRAGLTDLFRSLTHEAQVLAGGQAAAPLGPKAPPQDNGLLGPDPATTGTLTITVAVGASLFDDRFGLTTAKPTHLKTMPTFPDDRLVPAECHGDLLLQVRGDNRDTVLHAFRQLARATRGGMQLRWRIEGFSNPPRPAGAGRNLLGFKDGTANPDVTNQAELNRLVWAHGSGSEPGWTDGGTYQVVRIIRMLVEFWDRVSLNEQEKMFGRRKDTGAPLDGNNETDIPNYGADPDGTIIDKDAHIRRANPRTPETDDSRILRRGVSYDRGVDVNGNLDMGLVFNCFQQDVERQFEANQRRLAGEPLVDYISPTGGGYFFVIPGLRDPGDWYAHNLLTP
jgi:deferrochelatase/peroxidase EfeB